MTHLKLKHLSVLLVLFVAFAMPKACFCQEGKECSDVSDCAIIECKIAECKEDTYGIKLCVYEDAQNNSPCDPPQECKSCFNGVCNANLIPLLKTCGQDGCKTCFAGSCSEPKQPGEHCDPYDGCTECDGLGTCVDKIGIGCFCNGDEDCRDAAGGTVDSCKFWQAAAAMGKCES